jgi:hypothetical protein
MKKHYTNLDRRIKEMEPKPIRIRTLVQLIEFANRFIDGENVEISPEIQKFCEMAVDLESKEERHERIKELIIKGGYINEIQSENSAKGSTGNEKADETNQEGQR